MKKYIKKTSFILLAILLLMASTGCELLKGEQAPVEMSLPKIDRVNGSILELEHNVEDFIFKTTYDIGNYKFDDWRITDSKTIKMTAIVENAPNGTEIFIDHVHVDMALKSTSPQLDGMMQDSMDDKYHGFSQDGFFISQNYAYENVFAVEGFSKDIIEGWSFYCGSYGSGSLNSKRLTERNLILSGTYANKLTVVYDILIKNEGEKHYHIKSIVDEFLIPISSSTIEDM